LHGGLLGRGWHNHCAAKRAACYPQLRGPEQSHHPVIPSGCSRWLITAIERNRPGLILSRFRRDSTSSQGFPEKHSHLIEGPVGYPFVILRLPWHIGCRVGKGMHGVAVAEQLPVADARIAHFLLEA